MKAKKMRTVLPFDGTNGGIKKVAKVLRNVDGEMQVIHDFRQYLIKDGVLQNGCHIVRAKLTAPKKEGTPIAMEGYVRYDEMLEKGELIQEEGALKVILPKLNVGNKIIPIVVPELFICSDEGVKNEAYKNYRMYADIAYYSEGDTYYYEKRIRLNGEIEIRPSTASVVYSLNKTSKASPFYSRNGIEAYGMNIDYNTLKDTINESEVLYIKDLYIIA
jgi:hypothetical protein